jgi:uncharacterized RDD family membrane protein YckC
MDNDGQLPAELEQESEHGTSIITTFESLKEEEQEAADVQAGSKMEPTRPTAGFFRRVAAFIIDVVVLSIPLLILGFLFREPLYSIGPYGRFIGYAFIIPYFGYFNSALQKGQTIGKKVTKIAVVASSGSYLSLGKSFARAFILGIIFMFNQWALPLLENPLMTFVATIIIFGAGLSLFYSIIFNRTTRQGIHDLIIGSYVVNAPPEPELDLPKIPAIHGVITVGLIGIGLAFGLAGLILPSTGESTLNLLESESREGSQGLLLEEGETEELRELQELLLDIEKYITVNVTRLNRIGFQDQALLRDLNITLWAKTSCGSNLDYCQALIMETAELAFEHFDNIEELSGMSITVTNRFDLGLANGSASMGISWSMEDWQNELGK